MKIMLYILVIIGIFFVCSGIKITFSPFQIQLERWRSGLGWVFLSLGLIFLTHDSQIIGYKQCEKDVMEIIEKKEKEEQKESVDSTNQTEDNKSSTISL